jgi:XTP/dITP diphosphohydrolase
MQLPSEIALATRNRHKIGEILAICADWPVRWRTHGRDGDDWPDVEETGETYLDNALLKARAVAAFTGTPALADDSGLEVDSLDGVPGPRSARFAGPAATDEENLTKLLDHLHGLPPERRTARYRCVAALALPDGRAEWAEDICEGVIVDPPRGDGGFGYDPAFVPVEEVGSTAGAAGSSAIGAGAAGAGGAGSERTMAELSDEEKHAISHRGRAFRRLRSKLGPPPQDRRPGDGSIADGPPSA